MSLFLLSLTMTVIAVGLLTSHFVSRGRTASTALRRTREFLQEEARDRPGTCLVPTGAVHPFSDEMIKEVAGWEGWEFVAEDYRQTTRMLRFRRT